MFEISYTKKDIKTMQKMWAEGKTAVEIGEALRKTEYSVRQFMHRNREKYGFEKKQPGRPFCRAKFEKQWYGGVPFGHWSITKPWGKTNGRTASRSN